jgi:methionyl-tRNA formyltransferase
VDSGSSTQTVPADVTYKTLLKEVSVAGADLLVDVLRRIRDGTVSPPVDLG